MPPKLSAAERAQFKAEAKSAVAAEIRSKKRHSMNAVATIPAPTAPIPPLLKLKTLFQPKEKAKRRLLS